MPKPDAAALEGMRKFAKCMRDNGIENFPDPTDTGGIDLSGESGIDPRDPKFQDAQKKCEHNIPKPSGAVKQNGPGGGIGGGGK
jgi:hypothetical protein